MADTAGIRSIRSKSGSGVTARLARLDIFMERLGQQSWFSALGQPPTDAEIADGRQIVDGLMLGDLRVSWVDGLPAAAALLRRSDHSRGWADAETAEADRLSRLAENAAGARLLTDSLNRIMHRASDLAIGPAAMACSRAGIGDEALARVAAGAVSQAACHMALVLGAASDDGSDEQTDGRVDTGAHPFAARFRLFGAGRWPLTVAGGALHIL